MKKCSKCLHEKILVEFYKDKHKTDGRTAVCKDCSKIAAKNNYDTNKKQKCQKQNEYYRTNKEKIKEYKEKNRNKINLAKQLSRIKQRGGDEYDRYIKSAASISYDEMFANQNGLCAICASPPADRKRFSIDHCHKTGAVRGLLCHKCNLCLGHCGDDIAILSSAIYYLTKHQE